MNRKNLIQVKTIILNFFIDKIEFGKKVQRQYQTINTEKNTIKDLATFFFSNSKEKRWWDPILEWGIMLTHKFKTFF